MMTKRKPKKAMKKHTAKAKSKRQSRRPSRSLFNKLLLDLVERIDRQIAVTQSIKRANIPNDSHIYIEYQLRTVFGVMLDSQLRDLKEMQTRAGNLCTGDMIEKHENSRSRLWT